MGGSRLRKGSEGGQASKRAARTESKQLRVLMHELRNAHSALALSLDFIHGHDSSHKLFAEAVRDARAAHSRMTRHIDEIYSELRRLGLLGEDRPKVT